MKPPTNHHKTEDLQEAADEFVTQATLARIVAVANEISYLEDASARAYDQLRDVLRIPSVVVERLASSIGMSPKSLQQFVRHNNNRRINLDAIAKLSELVIQ